MPIDWSVLPVPTTALPLKCQFQDLETGGYSYLLYSDDGSETALGLPVMTLGNGERRSFVQTNIPVISLNRRAAQAQPEVKSKERVYAFFARWEEGTLEITRAIDHAQFVIKSESLLSSSSSGVLPLPVDRIAVPSSPAEDRSVYLACFPDYAITRESLMGMFSGNAGMVEGIQRIGPFQFRMTFRSPHAVGPVLGGRSSIYYARDAHIYQEGQVLVSKDTSVFTDFTQIPGPHDRKLHISFDEPMTGSEILAFFHDMSPVSCVYVHPPMPFLSQRREFPKSAVVFFHHRSAVKTILRGAKVQTLYLQDREMRVRSLC